MTSNRGESVESALLALLDALAPLLIELDVTPARLAQIARASFVKAGARKARKPSSGRPHLAMIAAVTGLPRSEVKRIVAANFLVGAAEPEAWPRALRVLGAWKQSIRSKASNRPHRLRIAGTHNSFAALCRAHSGDIPHRVILAELEKRGRIRISPGGTHVSVAPAVEKSASGTACKSLAYAASFLQYALREEVLLVRRKQRVPVASTVPRAYAEEAISGRLNELLNQLPRLFPPKKQRKQSAVNVYAIVARDTN